MMRRCLHAHPHTPFFTKRPIWGLPMAIPLKGIRESLWATEGVRVSMCVSACGGVCANGCLLKPQVHVFCFFKDFIYLFLERGEGREKERERNISVWLPLMWPTLGTWPETQACALNGNPISNPLVHSLLSIQ